MTLAKQAVLRVTCDDMSSYCNSSEFNRFSVSFAIDLGVAVNVSG